MVNIMLASKALLVDVINQHLKNKGCGPIQLPAISTCNEAVLNTMGQLCEEIEHKHKQAFNGILDCFQILPDKLHDGLDRIMLEMFADQVKTGIFIIIIYSG